MDIILYLLSIIQYLYQQNCWLINLICRYIPLKQWAFDDSHSPKYQKFRVDQLPKVQIIHHEWDWRLLIPYFEHRYHVKIKPVSRRKECDIPQDCSCPSCGAPQPYLYRNNGKAGQLKCKVCSRRHPSNGWLGTRALSPPYLATPQGAGLLFVLWEVCLRFLPIAPFRPDCF